MIRSLAYVGFVSPHAAEWRTFGPEVLGAELADDAHDGAVRLRVDDRAARITIRHGDRDDLEHLGWDVGPDGLGAAIERLARHGIVTVADAALAADRGVEAAAAFTDPFGFRHELTTGLPAGRAFVPGRPLKGSFLTGEQGLGHVVLIVPDLDTALRFYIDVLGFALSDHIEDNGLSLRFLHCNPRHHTLALAAVPGMRGLHHLMLELTSIDDVGTALDIVQARGIPLASTLGRHPNDLMTSFYVRTPSGFEVEYGTGGRTIDDATWTVATYDEMSIWGHRPPADGPLFPSILHPFEGAPA